MITAVAGDELALLRELQGRALDAVARRWASRPDQGSPGPVPLAADDAARSRLALRQVVEVTGRLAEAARHVATAAATGPAGWARTVEIADALSTTAQALRMLAELELAAIPGP